MLHYLNGRLVRFPDITEEDKKMSELQLQLTKVLQVDFPAELREFYDYSRREVLPPRFYRVEGIRLYLRSLQLLVSFSPFIVEFVQPETLDVAQPVRT